jgi:hypothetical protein
LDVLGDANAQEMLEAYAAECSIPALGKVNPQPEIYSALEQSGASRCFGVFEGDKTIGFSNVLYSIIPHYGSKVAVVESLFLIQEHRYGGNGLALMASIEDDARTYDCVGIFYSAPIKSRLASLLMALPEYVGTNFVYYRSLV